ncbi:MAG: hypothetical protein C0507_18770 [Cyanobacteria bacterium PR.3.49]|nr:hypothetical protein [Cyanobacteria bacterium PR.3.49]
MSDDDKNIMIGDLLVRSGLVTSADLTEAMQVSRRLGMPIGRVLTMSGNITPDTFQLALEAQSLIRDGVVPVEIGIEALGVASRDRQPLKDALGRVHHPHQGGSTNRLGELLVDALIITPDQLDQALKISVESGLPLGGTLVTQGIIHASLLPTVLRAQEQIRDGVVTREAAIEELKAAMKIWAKAEAAMKLSDYAHEGPAIKPSMVMSTLRESLEMTQPQPAPMQMQAPALPQQQQPSSLHAQLMQQQQPPQHQQPSSLHAQLQQQQQQYYQNQQPQPVPVQQQQTQPMQMPQHLQQPMPQQMQQMPQQMQPPMQQPMQQPIPTPIYGYNTPYGHAPYGGPAPDDPWGSWHGSVPRHHGLGVPLPGLPQPPAMPPEGYAPPPGYPPQPIQPMPQGGQQWHMPPQPMAQGTGQPPHQQPQQQQQMAPAQSNLHAQLQQQAPHAAPPQMPTAASPQPMMQPQYAQPPALPPSAPVQSQPVAEIAAPAQPQTAPEPAQKEEQPPETAETVQAQNPNGQLKNAAAQLASRLGWAAPKGPDAESGSGADLPAPKKLSWGKPQPPASPEKEEAQQEEDIPPPQEESKEKTEENPPSLPTPAPQSAPTAKSETVQPSLAANQSGEFKSPFAGAAASPFSAPTPQAPVEKAPAVEPPAPAPATPQASPAIPVAHDPTPAFTQGSRFQLELPKEDEKKPAQTESKEEDDEPDFKMEFDLELPAPFNKTLEQSTAPAAASAPAPAPTSTPVPAAADKPKPGQIAGFGKGTKITLKSDYAPNDTGRLFTITESDALTLLSEDTTFDVGDDKKESGGGKGKKGKGKASQSQTKLAKQSKGKKGQAGKSQTNMQSAKEPEPPPSWLPQKHQTHPAAMFGRKGGGAGIPDFIEDLVPAAQIGSDNAVINPSGAVHGKASSTQAKMASIKQRAVSLSVSNLLPVPLEIAEAQAELAYIVEHRGAPTTPPVTFTPPAPVPPQPERLPTIVELLTLSGFFTKKDVATALDKALEDSSLAPDLLMALGLVADDTLDVVMRCQSLTRNKYLTTEQAIYVLGAVRSGRLTFEDALAEIGK